MRRLENAPDLPCAISTSLGMLYQGTLRILMRVLDDFGESVMGRCLWVVDADRLKWRRVVSFKEV